MNDPITVFGLSLAIAGVVMVPFLWLGMRAERRKRLIDDVPTSRTDHVFIGLVELEGTADSPTPLAAWLTNTACVWYEWSIQERWSRWVTEHYTDSKGRSRTRRVHKSGWKTIDSGGETRAFFLRDDHGTIRVYSDGANVMTRTFLEYDCTPDDPLYYGKGPAEAIWDSDHRRRFCESGIAIGDPLYIIGQSQLDEHATHPCIAHDEHASLFIISTKPQEKIARGYRWTSLGWLTGALLLGGLSSVMLPHMLANIYISEEQILEQVIYAVVLFFTLCGIGWSWMVYNSMTELRHRVAQAWANVEVELKRRANLIPNLVSIVEALAAHTDATMTAITALRTQTQVTQPGQQGPDPRACMPSIRALAESYPQLASHSQFQQLSTAITQCENRLALARGYFNDIATHFNTRMELIPDTVIARLMRAKPQVLIHGDEFERAPVDINLSATT